MCRDHGGEGQHVTSETKAGIQCVYTALVHGWSVKEQLE